MPSGPKIEIVWRPAGSSSCVSGGVVPCAAPFTYTSIVERRAERFRPSRAMIVHARTRDLALARILKQPDRMRDRHGVLSVAAENKQVISARDRTTA